MSEPKVEIKRIVSEVRKLAEEYPDAEYKNSECYYTKGKVKNGPEQEGCIIGHALMRAYPDLTNKLRKCDNQSCIDAVEALFTDVLQTDLEDEDSRENNIRLEWLSEVQSQQDSGFSWKFSVESADRSVSGAILSNKE